MASTFGSSFTTTVGVINGIHGRAANMRLASHPSLSARLTEDDALVIRVADGSNCGSATGRDPANLSAGKRQLCPVGVAGD